MLYIFTVLDLMPDYEFHSKDILRAQNYSQASFFAHLNAENQPIHPLIEESSQITRL